MTSDDRPGIAERYATATGARSLKVRPLIDGGSGAVDVLISAGWSGRGIGASLMRLRAEFDCCRDAVRGTGNSPTTERALAMMRMRSLRSAKEAVGDLARKQAAVIGFLGADQHIAAITGRVLDVFLDPLCHHCDGRGFTGGGRHEHTGPPVLCRPCSGSGGRSMAIGHNAQERAFARHMLALLERSVSHAETLMARKLR